MDFPFLTTIGDPYGPSDSGGNVTFEENGMLGTVSFNLLTSWSMNGTLTIVNAGELANLDGFTQLMSAVYNVIITHNSHLTDISGLEGIGTTTDSNPAIVGYFDLWTANDSLNVCHVAGVLDSIRTRNDPARIWETAFPGRSNPGYCVN